MSVENWTERLVDWKAGLGELKELIAPGSIPME